MSDALATTVARFIEGPDGVAGAVATLVERGWPVPEPRPGDRRVAVVLDDLAGESGPPATRAVGVAVVDLPLGQAGVVVGFAARTGDDLTAVATRLLSVSADQLTALGWRRLTATLDTDLDGAAAALDALAAIGFECVRVADRHVDLVLEL